MNALPLLLPLLLASEPTTWLLWSQQGPDDDGADLVAGLPGRSRTLGRIPVVPGYEPRSDVSSDGKAWLMTALEESRDPDSATLWKLALPSGKPVALEQGVSYQRPLALPSDRVAYIKVIAHHPVEAEAMRAGELESQTVEIRLREGSGGPKTLARLDCYGAHLAGATESGIAIYLVSRDEAAFYLVSFAPGTPPRRIAKAPAGPFARDFSVHGDELLFSSPLPGSREWALWSVPLSGGEPRARAAVSPLAPAALASGGELLFTRHGEAELQIATVGGTTLLSSRATPLLLAADPRGRAVAFRRQTATAQELWWLDRHAGEARRLPTLRFFSVAGFAELP
jgi:hypothetical protein